MQRVLLGLTLGLLLTLGGGRVAFAADADAILGTWLNQDKDAQIEIAPCGDQLCGTIVWIETPLDDQGKPEVDDENPDPKLRTRPIVGLEILSGFPSRPDNKGVWDDGTIYDPNNGKTYSCKMSFRKADKLQIRGYIGISLLGRTEVWTRVDPADAKAARDAMKAVLDGAGLDKAGLNGADGR